MSEIEKATEHMLKIVEILKGVDKRLKNLEGNKMNIEGVDAQQIIDGIRDNLDYGEIADHINPSDVAEHIDQNSIVEDVAQFYGAEGIAEHVDVDQVAEHVEVNYKALAQHLIKAFMGGKEDKS